MTPIIRPFRTDEADTLRDIRFEALADLPMAFAEHLEATRVKGGENFGAGLAEGSIWGAWDGETCVAMAGLQRHVGANVEHRATVWGVYVSPRARGTGAGRALLRAIIDYGVALGIELFELAVGDFNTSARKLYASLGFVEIGILRNAVKIGPDYTHEVLMALFCLSGRRRP